MNSTNILVSPIGLNNARELSLKEMEQVGGGKQTFIAKATYNRGNDAEVQYDIEW